MMHFQSESDMTSLDPSSPRSPKRPVYYVQSPSRDSHDDGDKSSSAALTQTAATTPTYNTPTESPSHPSYGPQSRPSSASRISGGGGGFRWKGGRRRDGGGGGEWPERHLIEEECGRYQDLFGDNRGISIGKCRVLLGVVVFVVVFSLFCSVLWGASRPFTPVVSVKSLNVHSFYYGEGSDRTGVPTKILNLDSSVKMTIHNPATFFGIHVSSSAFKLIFSDLTLATGQLKTYYQPRKSKHTAIVELVGTKIPLYGAGAYLAASDQNGGVPMKLEFEIRSRGKVVGNLVKSKHRKYLSCSFVISSWNTKLIKFTEKTCKYITK